MENKEEKKEQNVSKLSHLTKEQLEQLALQLSGQIDELRARLGDVSMAMTFKRLDYLFKVVENETRFNSELVIRCTEEIENMLYGGIEEETKE